MKKRILILNSYSVERVTDEIDRNLKPSHHLYGIYQLQQDGYQILTINPSKTSRWYKLGNFLNRVPLLKFGNLDAQVQAFKKRKEYDIVYAPAQTQTMFLGLLAYFGIFNKKIVAVAHHPFLRGKMGKIRRYSLYFIIRGHAYWGALSSKVANEINQIARRNEARSFHWGADNAYFQNNVERLQLDQLSPTVDLIAVGRTGRDYDTLIKAFNNTDISVEIYCHKATRIHEKPAANVKLVLLDQAESLTYLDLIKLYKNARIMAIPMMETDNLCGLTSVTDAIALGMPMLITRNSFLEIDVEKEEFGFWVEPNDAADWYNKASQILKDETLYRQFCLHSKRTAEKFNIQVFYQEVLNAIRRVSS